MARILVASGDAGLRKQLSRHLAERGHEVVAAGSAQSALAKLREGGFDLALADLGMSSKGEGELCRRLVEAGSETAVVVLAAAEEEGRAREAMEGGAFDVLERPPSLPRLEGVLRRAREAHELRTQLRQAREEMERANRALAERERRLEEATETLLRREKMELLHRMASFLAHDLKNSVAVLSLVVENAARQMGNPAFLRDAFEAIAHHVGRMQRLVGLLTHLRPGAPMRFAQVDVNELLARVCQVSGLEEEGRVELQKRLSPLPAVEGDPAALETVFHNLVKNALEAMGEGGTLTVETMGADGGRGASEVEVRIRDTGPGMSPEFVERELFKPFRSGKAGGLGIGLFQCAEIVKAHGGAIAVESAPGRGTCFQVRLPVRQRARGEGGRGA